MKKYFAYLGPGIMMAGAAVGVSHLVQSTRAGADFGWSLLWIVLLANIIKYPFFEFGSRYTAATGNTTLGGYKKLGRGYLYSFLAVNIITAIGSIAAITYVTAALFANIIPLDISINIWVMVIMAICLSIFISGHYRLVDKTIKILMVVLVITTFIAFVIALFGDSITRPVDFVDNSPWDWTSLAFIIALMGWMPAPIEVSSWQSLWIDAKTRDEGKKPTLKQALFDFNFGYIICIILAVMFLGLGAMVMYGTGASFTNNAVGFAGQVIDLYTSTIGEFARPIIALAAFTTMFSTTITLLDAYPRTLGYGHKILATKSTKPHGYYRWLWSAILYISALVIIYIFTSGIKTLVDIVTIVAFMAAPLFAYLNMRLIYSKLTPKEAKPPVWLTALTIIGFIILIIVAGLFIYSRF